MIVCRSCKATFAETDRGLDSYERHRCDPEERLQEGDR